MGWKWFKKKKEEVAPVQYCCECGGKMMRQTTLDEFMDILSKEQKRLPIELENAEVVETIGLGGKTRRRRGMI